MQVPFSGILFYFIPGNAVILGDHLRCFIIGMLDVVVIHVYIYSWKVYKNFYSGENGTKRVFAFTIIFFYVILIYAAGMLLKVFIIFYICFHIFSYASC